MAAGDTINGEVRVQRETASGEALVPLGPLSSAMFDNRGDVANQLYVNPQKAFSAPPPQAGNRMKAPGLVFHANEVLRVQHQSANLEEAIDYDADEIEISIVDLDLQTGKASPRTLTVSSTELTANPTSDVDEWVTVYQETVPFGHRYFVAGPTNAAAVENA